MIKNDMNKFRRERERERVCECECWPRLCPGQADFMTHRAADW